MKERDMSSLSYKKAGVDIDKANRFIKRIKPLLKDTFRPGVIGEAGGFSGLFRPSLKGLKDPVLVASTDGVGTKLLLADLLGRYEEVGIDLVAMCVNDIIASGAEPLFFLDYIACGKLNDKKLVSLMKGITRGCKQAGCALIGGETAELPGMYSGDKTDIAGFCVGMVSRENILDGASCREGDTLIGLSSSGVHSNGFSLIREIFNEQELKGELKKELIKPTRIYVKAVLELLKSQWIKAAAHITGGGFYENIPRTLPEGMGAVIKKDSWPENDIFMRIRKKGRIHEKEMYRTFNMGIGFTVVSGPDKTQAVLDTLKAAGQEAWVIGEIVSGEHKVTLIT
ncbi:MAG TPA: phosphoribosylformylglycinamidine cyclo-ligase [Candidatus Aminicenantes bacterium]|nr:phosphoribosylformylglycinamidine cyclo-ligase [Candidatus Aminicenantes bacterium]